MAITRAPGTRPLFEPPPRLDPPAVPVETEEQRLRRENETLREELARLRPIPQRGQGAQFSDDDSDQYCGLI